MWFERLDAALKRPLRRFADAVAVRVAARLGDRLAASGPRTAPPHASFHDFLHAQRSIELSQMPKPARTLISAGCSGSWYFDWFDRWYGPVEHHIGIERFLPRPAAIPSNVTWIVANVAAMPEVTDASADLLFSGQNIEHLFGDDLPEFLLEAARIVRPGGHLVMDSPNREIANLLCWSMNEHTIELTPQEACDLVALAGFETTSLRGVWLCRDPETGAILPLDTHAADVGSDDVLRRVQLAARYPEHSFIWWLEACRTGSIPDAVGLRRRHADIFRIAWPQRCRRLLSAVGVRRYADGRDMIASPRGTSGFLLHGPYMPFAPGRYSVRFRLRRDGAALPPDTVIAVVDAIADGGTDPCLARREVLASELAPGRWTDIPLAFDAAELRWTGQLRVYSPGADALAVDAAVDLDDRSTSVWPTLARAG